MPRCAACGAKANEGAVRCMGCDADLASSASFAQVLGWVLIAVSTMPIGLGIVTEGENNVIPLLIGIGVLVLGIALMILGWTKSKMSTPAVLPDNGSDEGQG